jgi:predicted nuclease of restriction endonuclease-like RecB superfamily
MISSRWSRKQYNAFLKKNGMQQESECKIDVIKKNKYRNDWEREFGERVLPNLLDGGGIIWFEYEPFKIKIGTGVYIIPDFIAMRPNRNLIVYEVKGFQRPVWNVKWKIFKDRYFDLFTDFYLAVKKGGVWNISLF